MACCHHVHGLLNRRNDVRIGSASAEIAAHQLADLVRSLCLTFRNETDRGTDLPGRAVAALERIVIDEGLLHGMECTVDGKTFDCGNLGAVFHDREREA
jgi:hypothetical protein